MTTAERLRQQGREEGREQGRIAGKAEGQARVVLKLLKMKFGVLADDVEARVRNGATEDLDLWSERILRATSLHEVFGE